MMTFSVRLTTNKTAKKRLPLFVLGALICLLLTSAVPLNAADSPSISIQRHLSSASITIGEHVTYTLKVTYSPRFKVTLPQPGVGLAAFEIKDFSVTQPKKNKNGQIEESQTIELTTFTVGDYLIEELTLKYLDEKGEEQLISSEQLFLKVVSIGKSESDAEDIRPNKGPQNSRGSGLLYYLIGLLAAIIFMVLITRYYLKRRRKADAEATVAQLPPYEWAKQKLEWIRGQDFLASNQHKEYYDALSDCVRGYLMRLYDLPLLDRTTTETYAILLQYRPLRNHLSQINDLLREGDLVKFAKLIPEHDDANRYWQNAEDIIESLRPEPDVSEQGAES